jgi:polyisoprenoid-binding protein YceI
MSVVEGTKEQLASSGTWTVDPTHSTVEFRVKHMVVQTVSGRFRNFEGTIVVGDDPSVFGRIAAASVDTMHEGRNDHLRSADFFDVERFPEITFAARRMNFNGDHGRFTLPGTLTIKGINRPITLEGELAGTVVDSDGSERVAFTLRGRIDRADFGLVWNRLLETGSLVVGDTVDLLINVAAVRSS